MSCQASTASGTNPEIEGDAQSTGGDEASPAWQPTSSSAAPCPPPTRGTESQTLLTMLTTTRNAWTQTAQTACVDASAQTAKAPPPKLEVVERVVFVKPAPAAYNVEQYLAPTRTPTFGYPVKSPPPRLVVHSGTPTLTTITAQWPLPQATAVVPRAGPVQEPDSATNAAI